MVDQVKVLMTQNELQATLVALERAGVGQASRVLWETYYENVSVRAAKSSWKKLRTALSQFQTKIIYKEGEKEEDDYQ